MKKTLIFILAAVLLLGTLSGCGGGEAQNQGETTEGKTDDEINLVFVTPLLANPVWLSAKEGFETACADRGVKGDWVGPVGIDVDAMIKQIDLAIASKVDGVITMAINAEAMLPAFERLAEANIPLVIINSDASEATRLAYLGIDNKNFGKSIAELALKNLNGKKPVVAAMVADLTQPSAKEMLESAEEALAAAGDYEWAITVEDKSDSMVAMQKYQEIFNTYPDVNVVFNIVSEGAYAAAKVAEEKDMSDQLTIIGISVLDETADCIKKGTVYATMSENFYRMGYQPVDWLVDYIKDGKAPDKLINDTGSLPVTKDNLETYEQELMDKSLW